MEILLIILVVYLIYRKNYKKKYIKESKESAKVNEEDKLIYYRELPSNYSPAIVSILCNYQLEAYKDIPAVILNLCAKRYIDIKEVNGQYEFVVLENSEKLISHEQYVLDWIINKTTFDREKWKLLVESDACSLNLVENKDINEIKKKVNKSATKTILKPMLLVVLIVAIVLGVLYFGINALYNYAENSINEVGTSSQITNEEQVLLSKELMELKQSMDGLFTTENMSTLAIFGIITLAFVIGIPYFVISVFTTHKPVAEVQYEYKYKRTDKGNEDYIKWIAFKDFLVDFSLINTRDIQEVYIWEYYLAYATSLGIGEQVIKSSDERILKNKVFSIINYSKFVENLDRDIKQF